jgi:hypothetical protein
VVSVSQKGTRLSFRLTHIMKTQSQTELVIIFAISAVAAVTTMPAYTFSPSEIPISGVFGYSKSSVMGVCGSG